MRKSILILLITNLCGCQSSQNANHEETLSQYVGPIIDMHVHADQVEEFGPVSLAMCTPLSTLIPHHDPKEEWMKVWIEKLSNPACDNPIWSPKTNDELLERFKEQLTVNNVTAYISGRPDILLEWKTKLGDLIIPTIQLQIGRDKIDPDSIRTLVNDHGFKVLGEISNQYVGIAPNDPKMQIFYELAEEIDLPVAIHMGSGSPGAPLAMSPMYETALSNPLLLEGVLKKYPKMRVSIVHYGEPFIDELITMMYHYPQLYIDLGGIQWCYPREYFYEYHLKKLVLAGFGKRIMFGSDTFLWPELMTESIKLINEAPFLTLEQKTDIFYYNAARFMRIPDQEANK